MDEALEAAERSLSLYRRLGGDRPTAVALGRTAAILREHQRYAEADDRYGEALEAARTAGDLELQGTTLQHRAGLQRDLGHYDSAVSLCHEALDLFRKAGDTGSEMRTADLLGTAERNRGQLEAAEAWYARARELAKSRNARRQLAVTAQNVGILYQTRAEQAANPGDRENWLRRAVEAVKESLALALENRDQPGAASSYFQLGVLHRLLGELDEAERNARDGLAIVEPLGLPEVYKDCNSLAAIARARGDEEAAAEWQAKRDAKLAELERLRRGEGQGGAVPDDALKFVLALAQAAFQARASGALDPAAAEALARLADAATLVDTIGGFLKAVAGRHSLPPVPGGLPDQLQKILAGLAEAVREQDRRG